MSGRGLLGMILLAAASPASAEPCWPVEGDRILARDLARARAIFSPLDPQEHVAFAPVPGARRLISSAQLRRLAARYGLSAAPLEDVCFERAMEPLTPERILAALRASLAMPEAELELLDYSRRPVPSGQLRFPRSGLAAPPAAKPAEPVFWRGTLLYGSSKSLPVWARLRILLLRTRVVARRDLPAGKPLRAEDLSLEQVREFPFSGAALASIQQAAGALPRRAIPAGRPLDEGLLEPPNDIQRGDTVQVEVISGGARLLLEARAETAARAGRPLLLRSPLTGRRFQAVAEGKGKALLRADQPGAIP